jgi:putative FmdB family regulatory protein
MPTYDYYCKKCDSETEVFHGMSEEPEVICTECGEHMTKKISAGAAFRIAGGGTINTDYSKKYGHKKHDTASLSESAHAKAVARQAEKEAAKNPDPYASFRNT